MKQQSLNIEQNLQILKEYYLIGEKEHLINGWFEYLEWFDHFWEHTPFDNINETYSPLLNSLPKGTKNVPNYYYKGYHASCNGL